MVRIPRSEPSLQPQVAMQPQASGSGWGAPGRALQGLGKSIASLGDVFDGLGQEQIAEQDFQDKMLMLKTDNELGLNQVETHASYQGNGDDYLPQRTEYYATTTGSAISQMQPRNQKKAALFFEQRRGPYLERDAKFGGQRRQDTLISGINDTVSTEYGKLANVPPEEFEQRFNETVQGVDFIIQAAPLPDKLKEQVAKGAAEQAYGILKGLSEDPETAPEIVPKILKMIEEQPEEIDGGALEEVPAQPENGAEGVQGLPGSPSGPALPKPQKLGATGLEPPQSPQQASFRILDTEAPTHAERNRIFRQGGVVVNLDTNSGPVGKPTTPMVVIPDNATKAQRKAAEAYAGQMAQLYRDKFGVDLTPKVVKRSVNGRGRPSTIHTEPYAVTDPRAVAYFQTPEGVSAHAQILRDTLGKIPGVVFSIPHDPTRKGDHGAEANGVNEVALAKLVLADLKGGGSAPSPQRFAEANRLGGPDEESGSIRGPNKIPGEPKLISGPTPVRVADASGRFVPEQRPTYRSAKSQLRELLIRNSVTFQKSMLRAEREKERLEKERVKEVQERTFDEGFDLWRKGELTESWVDENRPLLKSRDDQKLYQMLRSTARHIDPKAYHELLTRIDEDPAGAIAQARDDLANGRITPSFYDRIESRVRRESKPETKTPAWAKRWEGEVREQVGTHQGDSWDRIERSQGAMREFEDYISGEIDKGTLDYDKVSKRAKQTIDDYKKRRVQQKQSALTIPQKWSSATPETITLDEVAEAKARILAASNEEIQAAGSDPEARKRVLAKYKADYGQLDQWEKLLTERAAANGEKLPPPKPPMKRGGPREAIKNEGQPLFSGGVPVDGEDKD